MVPITRQVAIQLADPPEGVDRSLWLYELCRFLTMKVNNLIIAFFSENPPCSSQTCPEMRASEWQYLCAVHDPPKSCCAIDYCCHTLDWATNTLTSPKYFPSRLTLGSEAGGGPQASMRHLTNVFRRLYRIFAHAWFQHRDVFWEVEGHDGLYVFFKTVCDTFSLIPEDNYTIPAEAEGPDAVQPQAEESTENKRLTILRKENETPFGTDAEGKESTPGTAATTRRHKHSPSTGSRVTTIAESAEDMEDAPQSQSPSQDVLKESPEPRPPSTVETRPQETPQSPVENVDSAATEQAFESNESNTEAQEQAQPPTEVPVEHETDSEQSEKLEGENAMADASIEHSVESRNSALPIEEGDSQEQEQEQEQATKEEDKTET